MENENKEIENKETSNIDVQGIKEAIVKDNKETGDKDVIIVPEVVVTFDMLNAIAYGKPLQEKFEELGIGECYKPGKKKKVNIDAALARLAEIKRLRESGIPDEEINTEADKSQARIIHEKKQEFLKEVSDKQDKENVEVKEWIAKELSEEALAEKIFRTDMNLLGGNKNLRDSLNRRRRILGKVYLVMFRKEYQKKEL